MELRQINTFIRAAQMKSFSKAADSLGYSQSAVTVQIRSLERELNICLFDRVGRQVILTRAGEQFLTGACSILFEVNKARLSVAEDGVLHGSFRLGVIDSLCMAKLPGILGRFRSMYPEVAVQIITGSPEELIKKMEHGVLDLVYILDEPRYNNLWCKALEQKEEVVFVASASLELGSQRPVELLQLLQFPFFLTERNANYRQALDLRIAAHNLSIVPFLESSDTALILRMLKVSQGISFLPRFMVEEDIRAQALDVLQVNGFDLSMYQQIFYCKDRWKTREMEAFIQLSKEMAL